MSTIHTMGTRLCALFFLILFCSTAFAAATKVELCHIPPEDPDNYHTIKISEKAVASHLRHSDLLGACDEDTECNPETGDCPEEVVCPCFTADTLGRGTADCETFTGIIITETDDFACSGLDCLTPGTLQCILQDGPSGEIIKESPSADYPVFGTLENMKCQIEIEAACNPPATD